MKRRCTSWKKKTTEGKKTWHIQMHLQAAYIKRKLNYLGEDPQQGLSSSV